MLTLLAAEMIAVTMGTETVKPASHLFAYVALRQEVVATRSVYEMIWTRVAT